LSKKRAPFMGLCVKSSKKNIGESTLPFIRKMVIMQFHPIIGRP
jgi:hypothetical protein